jgi:hypothetical protein
MKNKRFERFFYKLLLFFCKQENFNLEDLPFYWDDFLKMKDLFDDTRSVDIYSFFINSKIINKISYWLLNEDEPLKDAYYQLKFLFFLSKCCEKYPLLDKEHINFYLRNMLNLTTHIYKDGPYKEKYEILAKEIRKNILKNAHEN